MKNLKISRILIITLLLSFCVYSQKTFSQENDNKIKVKIIKYKNGKKVTIDTTISEGFVFDKTKIFDDIDINFDFDFNKDSSFIFQSFDMTNLSDKIGKLKHFMYCFKDSSFNINMDSLKTKLNSLDIKFEDLDKLKSIGSIYFGNKSGLKTFNFNDSSFHLKFDSLKKHLNFKFEDFDKLKNLSPLKYGNIIILSDDDKKEYVYKSFKGDKGIKVIISNDGSHKNLKMFTISGEDILLDSNSEGTITIICDKMVFSDPDEKDIEKLREKGISAGEDKNELDVKGFVCYPNPSIGKLKIRFSLKEKGKTTIRIFDMDEKVIYKEKLNNFSGKYEKEIDLSGNKPGIYFIKLSQGKNIIVKKIVLK